jgi:hypothetical protein
MAVVSIRMVLAHAPAQEPEDLVPLPAGFVKD